jgi:ABC-type multidrug transport system fused ATPase/permease subunit
VSIDIVAFEESTHTAQEAADAIGVHLGQIVKSLVFVAPLDPAGAEAGLEPVMALVRGTDRVDIARLAQVTGKSLDVEHPPLDARSTRLRWVHHPQSVRRGLWAGFCRTASESSVHWRVEGRVSFPRQPMKVRVHFFSYFRDLAGCSETWEELPAGSTVALVGPSGAGKTTVANLLLRFWDPDAGVVRLGGHDLREYELDDLRRRIALVAQDTYLFNDTLRSNILLARPGASAEELLAAVDKAALDDFVAALPDGLETVVGERGAQLSGGQRQRVAIARAFLKDAPILILDEATSHLDAVSEQAVRSALDVLSRDRTTVVIAHRLSTVRAADQIIVLDEGRVAEVGAHASLLARGGLYAHLVSRQLTAAVGS